MTVCIRMVFGISAVVLSLGLVPAPAAFAQDAMQLDIDFKNSLSQGPRYQEGHDFQGRHQGRHEEGRRTEKERRRQKGRPVEAIVRR